MRSAAPGTISLYPFNISGCGIGPENSCFVTWVVSLLTLFFTAEAEGLFATALLLLFFFISETINGVLEMSTGTLPMPLHALIQGFFGHKTAIISRWGYIQDAPDTFENMLDLSGHFYPSNLLQVLSGKTQLFVKCNGTREMKKPLDLMRGVMP